MLQDEVDADHGLTVIVADATGVQSNAFTAVLRSTTVGAFALLLQRGLQAHGIAAAAPTDNADFPTETGYDVVLPAGYRFKGTTVERNSRLVLSLEPAVQAE